MGMKSFILEKTIGLDEDLLPVNDDSGHKFRIAASPVRKHEVAEMIKLGQGLRILVGADDMKNLLLVWAGDGNSNIGAMHDTIGEQFGMSMMDRHVPLEMTKAGRLQVTTTAQNRFDDAREVEDILDRNREFQKLFGQYPIDYSRITEGDTYQPPELEVGDKISVGKFKNRKAEITGFKKDKNNHPVLKTTKGDQQLFKPRITKILNKS